jgi:hypothetical protein
MTFSSLVWSNPQKNLKALRKWKHICPFFNKFERFHLCQPLVKFAFKYLHIFHNLTVNTFLMIFFCFFLFKEVLFDKMSLKYCSPCGQPSLFRAPIMSKECQLKWPQKTKLVITNTYLKQTNILVPKVHLVDNLTQL